MNDSPDTRPVPSLEQLQAAALGLLEEILSRGGQEAQRQVAGNGRAGPGSQSAPGTDGAAEG